MTGTPINYGNNPLSQLHFCKILQLASTCLITIGLPTTWRTSVKLLESWNTILDSTWTKDRYLKHQYHHTVQHHGVKNKKATKQLIPILRKIPRSKKRQQARTHFCNFQSDATRLSCPICSTSEEFHSFFCSLILYWLDQVDFLNHKWQVPEIDQSLENAPGTNTTFPLRGFNADPVSAANKICHLHASVL